MVKTRMELVVVTSTLCRDKAAENRRGRDLLVLHDGLSRTLVINVYHSLLMGRVSSILPRT